MLQTNILSKFLLPIRLYRLLIVSTSQNTFFLKVITCAAFWQWSLFLCASSYEYHCSISGTSDYDRDGPVISEEEYEEMMDKLKAADNLYTEYTLEEIIYQLAKVQENFVLKRQLKLTKTEC